MFRQFEKIIKNKKKEDLHSSCCESKNISPKRKPGYIKKQGFTLIEVLVVIGILAILATLVLVAVNPSKQFKTARDTKRSADLATLMSGISQNIADHGGDFLCEGTEYAIPDERTAISSDAGGYDLASCLVPEYIGALPFDAGSQDAYWNNPAEYKTGYFIEQDVPGRVMLTATSELTESGFIVVTR